MFLVLAVVCQADVIDRVPDRIALAHWFTSYAAAVDTPDLRSLECLTDSTTVIDLSDAGGPMGSPAEVQASLGMVLNLGVRFQHSITNHLIKFTGKDSAEVTAMYYAPIFHRYIPFKPLLLTGGWYDVKFQYQELPQYCSTTRGWVATNLKIRTAYATAWILVLLGLGLVYGIVRWFFGSCASSRAQKSKKNL